MREFISIQDDWQLGLRSSTFNSFPDAPFVAVQEKKPKTTITFDKWGNIISMPDLPLLDEPWANKVRAQLKAKEKMRN